MEGSLRFLEQDWARFAVLKTLEFTISPPRNIYEKLHKQVFRQGRTFYVCNKFFPRAQTGNEPAKLCSTAWFTQQLSPFTMAFFGGLFKGNNYFILNTFTDMLGKRITFLLLIKMADFANSPLFKRLNLYSPGLACYL